VLETTETIMAAGSAVGSGFGIVTMSSLTRGVSNTTIGIRFMQLFSVTTQSFAVNWQVLPL
jgi:hypothetical protein